MANNYWIFQLLLLNRLHPYVVRFMGHLSVLISKHLTYPYLLRRHQLLGPWSRAGVALVPMLSWHEDTASVLSETLRNAAGIHLHSLLTYLASAQLALPLFLNELPIKHRQSGEP